MPAAPTHVWIGPVWIDVSISEKHQLGADVTEHPVEDGPSVADNIRPTPRTITIEGLVTNTPLELPLTQRGSAGILTGRQPIDVATNPQPYIAPFTERILGEPITVGLGVIPGVGQLTALAGAVTGALGITVNVPRREFAAQVYHRDRNHQTNVGLNALAFTADFDRVRAVYDALCRVVEKSEVVQLITGLEVYDDVALADLSFDRSKEVGRGALRFSATCKVLRMVSAETVKAPRPTEQRGNPGTSRGKQTTAPTPPAELNPGAKAQIDQSLARVLKTEGLSGLFKRLGVAIQ